MAKKAYIGIDGTARKVKKGYIGVGNVARKIKKAYIGVGGVARPCWSGGEVVYYGTVTPMSLARNEAQGGSVGNYALFAGGRNSNGNGLNTVDAYSAQLTHSTPSTLSATRAMLGSASDGTHVLFAGGYPPESSVVDAFDASLTRKSVTSLSAARDHSSGAVVGQYFLFAGGRHVSNVDVYDRDLTKLSGTSLRGSRWGMGAAEIDGYAIFGGGNDKSGNTYATVDAFGEDLVRTSAPDLCVGRIYVGGGSVGKYGLLSGGHTSSGTYTAYVDVYDSSLTRTAADNLQNALIVAKSEGDQEHLVIVGGADIARADEYNDELVHTILPSLQNVKYPHASAKAGAYLLFGVGITTSGTTVEAYRID